MKTILLATSFLRLSLPLNFSSEITDEPLENKETIESSRSFDEMDKKIKDASETINDLKMQVDEAKKESIFSNFSIVKQLLPTTFLKIAEPREKSCCKEVKLPGRSLRPWKESGLHTHLSFPQ